MSQTEANQIAALAVSAVAVQEVQGVPHALVPEGYDLKSLEKLLDNPVRLNKNLSLLTMDSFIKYVNKYKDERTSIFVDNEDHSCRAEMDYHTTDAPEWCAHIAKMGFPKDDHWKDWVAYDKRKFLLSEFGDFLRDRTDDIVAPNGSELLSLVENFKLIRRAEFSKAQNTSTGEIQFTFNSDNQNGTVEVPEMIQLGLSPFKGGDAFAVSARIKYRLDSNNGQLTIWYELIEPDRVVETAFNEAITKMEEGITEVDIFYAR